MVVRENRQTERQTDKNRQLDKQTDGQKHRQTDSNIKFQGKGKLFSHRKKQTRNKTKKG